MSNGDVPPLSRSSRLSRLTRLSRHSSKRRSNLSSLHDAPQERPKPIRYESIDGQLDFGDKETEGPAKPPEPVAEASDEQPKNAEAEQLVEEATKPKVEQDAEQQTEQHTEQHTEQQTEERSEQQTEERSEQHTDQYAEQLVEHCAEKHPEQQPEQQAEQVAEQRFMQEEQPEYEEGDDDDQDSFDLKAPQPNKPDDNLENVVARFYSADHLDLILRSNTYAPRLRRFLDTYMPRHGSALSQYIESRKAFAAIEFANAVAHKIPREKDQPPLEAASFDDAFSSNMQEIAEALIEEALPAYLNNRLVTIVTESLVKDILGNQTPFMKDLVPNLAEVYCLTDPALEDNPIVYASDEFYNMSQYTKNYVIGRNCRFLQGKETSRAAILRMKDAIKSGQESGETVLNYRRDGTPFVNLLMVAPLYDNKGVVRYFLGAQIDVTPLIEEGRGLDSFAQLLAQDEADEQPPDGDDADSRMALGELGEMLNESEVGYIQKRLRGESEYPSHSKTQKRPTGRRVLSSDGSHGAINGIDGTLWPNEDLGPSGRLPGVYRNYLLVRPYPSLRITFTSPALQIPGLIQTKLLDRIGGSDQVKKGLVEALSSGTSVTAKINWIPGEVHNGSNGQTNGDAKPRWIHCTPLLGSDEKVGVWMIVIVEEEEVTGMLNRSDSTKSSRSQSSRGHGGDSRPNEMYSDYLKGERNGRPQTAQSQQTNSSARE